jgi:hypothetical protein
MKPNSILVAVSALIAGALAGCGASGGSPVATTQAAMPPAQSHSQSLDTEQVLGQARKTSESADPYPVNAGALTLTDTSDSSEPIAVNAI